MDPCLDDCVTLAKRLDDVGRPVYLDVLSNMCHGFLNISLVKVLIYSCRDFYWFLNFNIDSQFLFAFRVVKRLITVPCSALAESRNYWRETFLVIAVELSAILSCRPLVHQRTTFLLESCIEIQCTDYFYTYTEYT